MLYTLVLTLCLAGSPSHCLTREIKVEACGISAMARAAEIVSEMSGDWRVARWSCNAGKPA